MRTIAVASSKGGVGKTTIACCLAWRAALETGRVAAIDLNRDQGNFEQWAGLRDKPLKGIELIKDYGDLTETIPQLGVSGFKWAIIDTMPGDLDVIELATLLCDVLLVPIKTSIYDAAAILPMLEIARDRRKPFTFVLSDVDTRHKVLNAEVRGQQWNIRCRAGLKDKIEQIAHERDQSIAALVEEVMEAFIASLAEPALKNGVDHA